jgi:hypothetical protein
MKQSVLSYQDLMGMNPEFIGIVRWIRFYEHPLLGDEAPLIGVCPDGSRLDYDFWDLPTELELSDLLVDARKRNVPTSCQLALPGLEVEG